MRRFIVDGTDRTGWLIFDTEDGNRIMDDRPSSHDEAVEIANEYEGTT